MVGLASPPEAYGRSKSATRMTRLGQSRNIRLRLFRGGNRRCPERAMRSSSETEALFTILRQLVAPAAAGAIEALVNDGSDRSLCRVNALDFAAKQGLDEEEVIAAFL